MGTIATHLWSMSTSGHDIGTTNDDSTISTTTTIRTVLATFTITNQHGGILILIVIIIIDDHCTWFDQWTDQNCSKRWDHVSSESFYQQQRHHYCNGWCHPYHIHETTITGYYHILHTITTTIWPNTPYYS